jgi:GNAT superfamily N-acetyltransferase
MRNLHRKILSGLSSLCRGEFFLLVEILAARLLPAWLCRMKKSIFYRLDSEAKCSPSKMDNGKIVHGTETLVQKIVLDLYDNAPEELHFYEHYFHDGIEPWGYRSNGKVIGVIWLYTGSYLAMWEGYDAWLLDVQIESNGKFFTNVFTDPAARGKGVFTHIAEVCFSAYPESPFYTCIEVSNMASIRSHEKVGFRRCAVAYYVRFFQKTFCLFISKKGKWRWLTLKRGQAAEVSFQNQK